MKILARHKWVSGATITESVNETGDIRRFTATIRGFRNWKIYQGKPGDDISKKVQQMVIFIRDSIDAKCESIFSQTGYFISKDGIKSLKTN